MNRTPVITLSTLVALALFTSVTAVRAADQVVTDFGDDGGPNQLRAKLSVLQSSGGGTLTFAGGGPATIKLASGDLPPITANSVVDGGSQITIEGTGGARFFVVNNGVALTVRNIVLSRGYFNGEGGAIFNQGSLTLESVTFANCYAPLGGGALATTGPVDITGCTFADGISSQGAAIYAHTPLAVLTINSSSFHGNMVSSQVEGEGSGGAINLSDGAAITMRGSDVFNNKASRDAGGIACIGYNSALSVYSSKIRKNTGGSLGGGIFNSGTANFTNSTISGNTGTIAGGMFNSGIATLKDTTLSGNKELAGGYGGGGISNYEIYAELTLENVTLSGNTAGGGGAALENSYGAKLTATNVTVSGNTTGNSGGQGGGLHNYKATATITNATFFGNSAPTSSTSGGGIFNYNDPDSHLSLRNVIIAHSLTGGNGRFEKALDENDANLSSDNTCNFGPGRDGRDLKLGPLASNGGPTQTHALLPGSPAITAADTSVAPLKDQRGYARVGPPDAGAYEFNAVIPVTLGNISTRLRVETGNKAGIGGFIITGTHPKKVLLRAIGPSTHLPGALANPKLELRDSTSQLLATNDDWGQAANHDAISATGIAPKNALESAILKTLEPGAYTALLSGVNDSTGLALVEAYDLDRTTDSVLANISTRGLVGTGDNALIGGFIVLGGIQQNVIIRGLGPSLPLAGKLLDPNVELRDQNGTLIVANNNWRSTQEAEIIATGIPPTSNQESAIIQNLNPGSYTATLSGVNATTGLGVIEIYQLR